MNNPLRARGMADVAFAALSLAFKNAGLDITSRSNYWVTQAQGDAPASKGYHASDGVLDGDSYTAAADISTKGLTNTQKATLIEEMTRTGWVAFFRNWMGNVHIHGNYAGLPQKRQLDGQNEDFFAGKDGLVGHRRIDDEWWFPERELRKIPERMFRLSNPKTGKGVVVSCPLLTVNPPAPVTQSLGFFLNTEAKPRFWMPVFDGVAYAPVRAFGGALGFDVEYNPATNSITFDGDDQPIALKIVAGVGHAPVRQLVREVGLRIASLDMPAKKVVVTR